MALTYERIVKIKAKEVFEKNCLGMRFVDIEYSDELIGTIYGIHEDDVWNDIEDRANVYHELLGKKNLKEVEKSIGKFMAEAPLESPSTMVMNETCGVYPNMGN